MDSSNLRELLARCTADPLERLRIGEHIRYEVEQRRVSPHPKHVNDFLDVMTSWLTGSNFKVTIVALEILDSALDLSSDVLASYYFDRIVVLIERMGDSKKPVRDLAINLLNRLAYLENSSPVMVVDRLMMPQTGFDHKQFLVKIGSLILLQQFLAKSFALVIQQTIQLIPSICKLTNCPNSEVRDTAYNTLHDIMVFGGTTLIDRINSTQILSEQKMEMLVQRYHNTISVRGDLPPKHAIIADTAAPQRNSTIRRSLRSPAKIAYSNTRLSTPTRSIAPPMPAPVSVPQRSREVARPKAVNNVQRSMSIARNRSSSCAPVEYSIGVDDFRKAFTTVPKTTIFSTNDIRMKFDNARSILSDPSADWSKRSNQLKLVRSYVLNLDASIDQRTVINACNSLADALVASVRDLRSSIVRESAITCAFLVETFGENVRQLAEHVLPAAIAQVPVTTKVTASSAATLTLFIVENVKTRQIVSLCEQMVTSKAKEHRKQLAILLEIMISKWDSNILYPHLQTIVRLLTSCINDADSETRTTGRKAFTVLDSKYADAAEQVFQNLDSSKRRTLREPDSTQPETIARNSFLSQRSSSAIDSRARTNSRLPRYSNVPSSGYGRPKPSAPSSTGMSTPLSSSSTSSSSSIQAPMQNQMQRIASNLGNSSFVGSLTLTEASNLQNVLNRASDEMYRGSDEDEDSEFLIQALTPPRTNRLEDAIRACTMANNLNDKKDAVKTLATLVSDTNLDESDVKKLGDTLLRLLSETGATVLLPVLETICTFIRSHHANLQISWIKLFFAKLFSKYSGGELMPNVAQGLTSAQKSVLSSIDCDRQMRAACALMCDPVHLLAPRARLALLEHMCDVLETSNEQKLDEPYIRQCIDRMFQWMFDQRSGAMLMPVCERFVCAMFAINASEFTIIFADMSSQCKEWVYRILQLNGQKQSRNETIERIETPSSINNNNITNSNNNNIKHEEEKAIAPPEPRRVPLPQRVESTAHLIHDRGAQAEFIQQQLMGLKSCEMRVINESMMTLNGMMMEGSFTMWSEYFDDLLAAIYQVLASTTPNLNKKLALRILMKMCTAQASKLFESTDTVITNVLAAVASSTDITMSVAAEDCLRVLATHLPLRSLIAKSRHVLQEDIDDATSSTLILKMLTRMFDDRDIDELEMFVDEIAPCVVSAYSSNQSSVRKCVVVGLATMRNRFGVQRMQHHLEPLNEKQMNLVELYSSRTRI